MEIWTSSSIIIVCSNNYLTFKTIKILLCRSKKGCETCVRSWGKPSICQPLLPSGNCKPWGYGTCVRGKPVLSGGESEGLVHWVRIGGDSGSHNTPSLLCLLFTMRKALSHLSSLLPSTCPNQNFFTRYHQWCSIDQAKIHVMWLSGIPLESEAGSCCSLGNLRIFHNCPLPRSGGLSAILILHCLRKLCSGSSNFLGAGALLKGSPSPKEAFRK